MDRILIRGLRVGTHLGAPAEERARTQHVLIDVEARCDLRAAGASDDLADTVDYGELVAAITRFVESSNVALLERLAEEIAGLVSSRPRVIGVTVTIAKEHPPLLQDVTSIAVRIER